MTASRVGGIAGFIIHFLLGGLLIAIGCFVTFGTLPPEAVQQNQERGLSEEIKLIGIGQIVTGLLLILPWTAPLGTLLMSAFFGGTICFHMQYNESYVIQSIMLLATWLGAFLRYPQMFDPLLNCCAPKAITDWSPKAKTG